MFVPTSTKPGHKGEAGLSYPMAVTAGQETKSELERFRVEMGEKINRQRNEDELREKIDNDKTE